jgi:hypothetical protein
VEDFEGERGVGMVVDGEAESREMIKKVDK